MNLRFLVDVDSSKLIEKRPLHFLISTIFLVILLFLKMFHEQNFNLTWTARQEDAIWFKSTFDKRTISNLIEGYAI